MTSCLSPGPVSARTSIVIKARAARRFIIVALIGRRSDRAQSRRVVIAGRFVRRAASIHDDENGTQKKPE